MYEMDTRRLIDLHGLYVELYAKVVLIASCHAAIMNFLFVVESQYLLGAS